MVLKVLEYNLTSTCISDLVRILVLRSYTDNDSQGLPVFPVLSFETSSTLALVLCFSKANCQTVHECLSLLAAISDVFDIFLIAPTCQSNYVCWCDPKVLGVLSIIYLGAFVLVIFYVTDLFSIFFSIQEILESR